MGGTGARDRNTRIAKPDLEKAPHLAAGQVCSIYKFGCDAMPY